MTYGIFILKAGQWELYEEYRHLSNARQELDYLQNMLGVTAKIFRKS